MTVSLCHRPVAYLFPWWGYTAKESGGNADTAPIAVCYNCVSNALLCASSRVPVTKKRRPKTKELRATKESLETEVPILREIAASEEVRCKNKRYHFDTSRYPDVLFFMRALPYWKLGHVAIHTTGRCQLVSVPRYRSSIICIFQPGACYFFWKADYLIVNLSWLPDSKL